MRDPSFPALHIRPRFGWLNDPNGLCRIDGTFHVFFQFNPIAPVHRDICWGHATSTDLLHWQEAPVALRPRPGLIDGAGCWSGCVIDDAGTPTAVYTANPDHAGNAGVTLARSDRSLIAWEQDEKPVLQTPDRAGIGEVRDPFLFSYEGKRYALQGAGERSGRPQILLYDCDDLKAWIELDPLLTDDDPIARQVADANIWECPNLARIDARWVLLISIWRWVDDAHHLAGVRYLVGELVRHDGGLRFQPSSGGTLDEGPAFYAPQLMTDGDRTLLWGWSWELGRSEEQVAAAGWAGVLTFPRELSVREGILDSGPASELARLRTPPLAWQPGAPVTASAFEIVATGPVTLRLVDDGTDSAVCTSQGPARILVDGSLVEMFDAGVSFTTRGYPTSSGAWIIDAAPKDVTVYGLELPTPSSATEAPRLAGHAKES